ncbi:prenylated flavin chaperone LpdD [Clostridium lacusfryxellense]|uniref:prenylated flavin chaperone LpdD n=1 Tax=Clostridium lacusfryxellense TaxID=205328 RepID=UPI001C0B0BE9|nr:hypothetical protein [Clostridium lacusfryxellense]MBU3112614.1 hypothetical protein [Clostridium lacusfryxellense]
MQQLKIKSEVYGYDIEANITAMSSDIHILLTGGCLPHTVAVSIFEDVKEVGFIQLDGHKDGLVSSKWAKKISEEFHCRVTVVCGIHYDNVTGHQRCPRPPALS